MQRDYDRDDPRRRARMDDDPRDDPRERFGNEEDAWSREYRRAYAEQDLPRRMQDDRPYNRPGYEPEVGLPGGRPNIDLRRQSGGGQQRRFERFDERASGDPYGYDFEQPANQPGHRQFSEQGRQGDDRWQRGYYGQGRRWSGDRFTRGEGRQTERYGQPASPYDQGDVSPWYGGDTGMGDTGSSQTSNPYDNQRSQYGSRADDRFRGGYGTPPGGSFNDAPDWFRSERFEAGQFGGSGRQLGGRFGGVGPRGYQRSDERIHEDVCEILTHHGEIDASDMDVEVRHATVILRGTAPSGRVRRLTEEIVENVPGVQDVQNELKVTPRTGYSRMSSGAMTDTGRFASDRGTLDRAGRSESGTPAYGTGVASTSGVSTRSGPGEPGVGAGAGPSQYGNRWQIRETMDVVGSDGESVGTVKEVRGTDFLADRTMARDVYVPFSAVQTVDGDRVMLRCRASEVDDQRWPQPELTGSQEAPPAR